MKQSVFLVQSELIQRVETADVCLKHLAAVQDV